MNKLTSTLISIAVITLLLAMVFPASAASDTTVLSGNAKNVAPVSEMKQVTSKLQNSLESRSYAVNDASVTTVDFENIPEWTSITDQYKDQGVTFSGDTPILTEGQSLNYGGYPPRSGINVVGPQSTGIIQASFTTSVSNVEVYYWSKYGIQLEAYDKNNKLIKTISDEPDTTGYEHGPTMYSLSISNTPGIASVIIRGTPGYYIIDDFSFTSSPNLVITEKNLNYLKSTNQWKQSSLLGEYLASPANGLDAKYIRPVKIMKYVNGKMTKEVIGTGVETADDQGYKPGECVSFVKALSHSKILTKNWIQGDHVIDTKDLAAGTVIATFNENHKYDGHAAVYIGPIKGGFQVWDQNYVQSAKNPNDIGAVGKHDITTSSRYTGKATNYYAVKVAQ